jgi:hypothetical protein
MKTSFVFACLMPGNDHLIDFGKSRPYSTLRLGSNAERNLLDLPAMLFAPFRQISIDRRSARVIV